MYKNILIPVAADQQHDPSASFEAARTLADEGATFTLLHVIEAIPVYVAAEVPSDIMMRSHEEAKAALAECAKGMPEASTVLVAGHAGSHILEHAKTHNIDCIVIASHKPGIQDFFLGSTAARVVRHAPCSVHVIR